MSLSFSLTQMLMYKIFSQWEFFLKKKNSWTRDYEYICYWTDTLFQKIITVYRLIDSKNKIIKYYYYLDKRAQSTYA